MTLSLLASEPLLAQTTESTIAASRPVYRNALTNTLNLIQSEAIKVLRPADAEKMKAVKFEILDKESDFSNIYASPTKGVITIPLDFIGHMDQVDFAFLLFAAANLPPGSLFSFVSDFVSVWRYNLAHARRGAYKPLPIFSPRYSGLSQAQANRVMATQEFRNQHVLLKISSLSLIVLHEFAHINGVRDEDEADKFAAKISDKMDMNPMGGIWTYLVYSEIEDSIGSNSNSKAYLPAACRVLTIAETAVSARSGDRDFQSALERDGKLQDWRSAPRRIKEILSEKGLVCDSEPARKTPVAPGTSWPRQ